MANRDKLSFLPDEIQHQIVSYLSTEDAYKTSLLSTKWRKVCSSLSNLNFDLLGFSDQVKKPGVNRLEAFPSFVNQTLALHDESDINSFNLEFGMMVGVASLLPYINQWISFAISHNARKFRLFPHGHPLGAKVIVPPSLFTLSSLTSMVLATINLILPKNITLPNLKSLTLISVTLVDADGTKCLCLSSPLLEDLTLWGCFWHSKFNTLLLPAPNLKDLALLVSDRFNEIELSSTTLRKFWYQGSALNFGTKIINSSLVEATLILTSRSWDSNMLSEDYASKMLVCLSNVGKLSLHGHYIEYLAGEQDLIARLPTLYCTLKDLALELNATLEELKIIILLLRSYPCLQTLRINFKPCIPPEDYEETGELDTQAVLNQLACVEFHSFEGCNIELGLVRYLLGNATALEKMNITLAQWSYTEPEGINPKRINENIQMFTRVSPDALISVSVEE